MNNMGGQLMLAVRKTCYMILAFLIAITVFPSIKTETIPFGEYQLPFFQMFGWFIAFYALSNVAEVYFQALDYLLSKVKNKIWKKQ